MMTQLYGAMTWKSFFPEVSLLTRFGENDITLNPKKSLSLDLTLWNLLVLKSYKVESDLPQSSYKPSQGLRCIPFITGVRLWFVLNNQVSYAFSIQRTAAHSKTIETQK